MAVFLPTAFSGFLFTRFILCGLTMASSAFGSARIQPEAAQDSIHLSGNIELARLLDLCADRLAVTIEYDPSLLKGTTTLRASGPVSDAGLWDFAHQFLAQRGLTTVRSPGRPGFIVTKLSDAAQASEVISAEHWLLSVQNLTHHPGFSSVLYRTRRVSTRDALEAIRPLVSKPGGAATALGESNMLLLSDVTPRLKEILSFLQNLDLDNDIVQRRLPIRHRDPAAFLAILNQAASRLREIGTSSLNGDVIATMDGGFLLVAPEDDLTSWSQLIESLDVVSDAETRTYVPTRFPATDVARLIENLLGSNLSGASDSARVVIDEMTGTLFIAATPTEHIEISTLIERLNTTIDGSRPMRSFAILNRPVEDLLDTLSRLIDGGALDARGDPQSKVREAASQHHVRDLGPASTSQSDANLSDTLLTPSPEEASPRPSDAQTLNLFLSADKATNTLIAIGEPRMLSQLESLLQMLDVRQPQVMLEVVLVSITDTDAVNLGVELERLGNVGDAAFKLASLFGLSTAGGGARAVGDAAGFTGAVLNPGEFSVVVRALQAINKGRSLSNPKVLVTNNEQARFSSVLQQPFVRTDTTSNTATSSFGGSDSAGTTISVKPQIAAGDHLVLTYSINLSSFVGTPAAAGLPPPKQQNSVDSVATIPDGHTVAVGGLELESDSTSTSQIPLLGDVPLIGELFKNRAIGSNRTRFFAFIKATVLRSSGLDDLKYISRVDRDAMGVDDGFPEVRPRVIR